MLAQHHEFAVRKDEVIRDSDGNIVMRQLVCNNERIGDKKSIKNDSGPRLSCETSSNI